MSKPNHFIDSVFTGAIGHRRGDRRVELGLQLRIRLAQADRDTEAQRSAAVARPRQHHLLVRRYLDHALEVGNGREHAVHAAGGEVEIVLLGGLVLADLDHVLEIFLEEVGLRRRGLHADDLALERRLESLQRLLGHDDAVRVERIDRARVRKLGERVRLQHGEGRRRAAVDLREGDGLLALVGDVHAGHDGVELARVEPGDHAVERLRDDLALGFHSLAEVLGQVDLETDEFSARVREVPRLVSAFGGDLDVGPILGLRQRPRRHEQQGEQSARADFHELHPFPPSLVTHPARMLVGQANPRRMPSTSRGVNPPARRTPAFTR
jgi:hypothetical protein